MTESSDVTDYELIGMLTHRWVVLQDVLGAIFAALHHIDDLLIANASWQSLKSDYAQREMLKAAAEMAFYNEGSKLADIRWILDRTQSLSEQRNNAIHGYGGDTTRGHERAQKLGRGDLTWSTNIATALLDYAYLLYTAVQFRREAWPTRPTMPKKGDPLKPRTSRAALPPMGYVRLELAPKPTPEEAAKRCKEMLDRARQNGVEFPEGIYEILYGEVAGTTPGKICPECSHVFQGNGWDGIDAHWRAKHDHVMPYEEAWPRIQADNYISPGKCKERDT